MNKRTFDYYNSEYDFYLMSVKVNPLNIVYVPKDILTQDICDEALKVDFRVIKDIPKGLLNHDLVREILLDDPFLIRYVPIGYISKSLLGEVIDKNPNAIRVIANTLLGDLSNTKIINAIANAVVSDTFNYDGTWDYIFNKIDARCWDRIVDKIIEIDPIKVMNLPIRYVSSKAARKIVEKDPYLISYIPAKFVNQEMYEGLVLKYPQLFNSVPKKYVNEEMCMKIIKQDVSLISAIPEEYMSKDLCMMALRLNPLIIDKVPKEYIDNEMFKQIKMLLPLNRVIDLFNDTDNDAIKLEIAKDIWRLLETYGSVNEVAKNNGVSANKLSALIEDIKPIDDELYEVIKNKLISNKTLWVSNVVKDGNTLIKIIGSLGIVESVFLSREQKIKFAYLYNKLCVNTLEDIYTFTNRYPNKVDDIKTLRNFFKRVLKYNYLNEDNTPIPEKKTILYNNKWLNKFDRNDYFKFKDGVPTAKNKYLEHEVTVSVVDEIINALNFNSIPLNDMVVKEAIREYFNGNLKEYIDNLKSYDNELKNDSKLKK